MVSVHDKVVHQLSDFGIVKYFVIFAQYRFEVADPKRDTSDANPSLGPISFIFMQLLEKNC